MPKKLLCVLTGVALTSLTCGSAFGSNNKAMDADIHSVELQWEHIKFDEAASPNQFAHIDTLANFTASLVQKYPGRAEPLIWQGIVTSEEAGMANTLSAMGYAKTQRPFSKKPIRRTRPRSMPGRRRASACSITACQVSLRLRRQRQGAPIAGAGSLARAERHGRELFLCRFPDGPA